MSRVSSYCKFAAFQQQKAFTEVAVWMVKLVEIVADAVSGLGPLAGLLGSFKDRGQLGGRLQSGDDGADGIGGGQELFFPEIIAGVGQAGCLRR